jgi:hypothetical protein
MDPQRMSLAPWRKSSYSNGERGNCVECASAAWQTSSYSNGRGGECVEVAELPTAVALRDSKHPARDHLTLPGREWTAFLTAVKHGEL